MNTTTQKVKALCAQLLKKQKKANALAIELVASLAVRDIWPNAFANGCSATVCAREVVTTMQEAQRLTKQGKTPELKEMYIQRSDGERYKLTTIEYWALKSNARGKTL